VNHKRLLRTAALVVLVAAVAACSKSKRAEKPAELVSFQSSARIERVWSANVGNSAPKLRLGLSLAAAGEALFVANHNGEVFAFNQANGKRLWRTATKLPLTGGPGAGEGLVVAGASHGDIVALDAATGEVKWKSYVNSEILAAPVIANQLVVMRLVDGRVVALRAADGKQAWSAEEQVPRLSLRGTSRPTVAGNVVLNGFDNGRVLALQLSDGGTVWDASVSPPSGRTELERVNDIDTQVAVQGRNAYVVSFQGKAARIDMETGEVVWTRDISSYSGLVPDEASLYVTSTDGSVQKVDNRNGIEAWKQQALRNRRLSPPAVLGELVAVADLEGYVHLLDRETGALAARTHALSTRVSAEPVVSGDMLFMLDAAGNVVALRATRVAAGTGTNTAAESADGKSPATLRPR
jgi:outer membrane protein assembly factor BamB